MTSPRPSRDTLETWLWDLNGGKPRPEDIVVGPPEREEWFDDGEIPVEINTTVKTEWKNPPGPGRPISELVEEMRAAGCEIPEPNRRRCEKLCANCQAVAKRKPPERWTCRNCSTRLSRESNKQKNIDSFYWFACTNAIASYNTPFDGAPGPRGVETSVYIPPHAPKEKILLGHELQRDAAIKRGEKIFQDLAENHLGDARWSVHFPSSDKKHLPNAGTSVFRMDWAVRDLLKAKENGDTDKVIALAINVGLLRHELAVYPDLEMAQEMREKNAANARKNAAKKAEKDKFEKPKCRDLVRKAYEQFKTERDSKDFAVFFEQYLPALVEKQKTLKTITPGLARRITNLKPSGIRSILRSPRPGKKPA